MKKILLLALALGALVLSGCTTESEQNGVKIERCII